MYALKKFGIEETDRTKLYKFIGPPLTESFEKFYGFTKEQSLDGVKYYREYYHDKGIYENRVYDGLEEVLKKINEAGNAGNLVCNIKTGENMQRLLLIIFTDSILCMRCRYGDGRWKRNKSAGHYLCS